MFSAGCNMRRSSLNNRDPMTGTAMTASRIVLSAALIAALGLTAACGRRAALDTPYQAAVDAREDARKAGQPVPPEPEKPVEDKPFILDPLL